jgi:RNA polymerase sigma factor (sigma-70 family)
MASNAPPTSERNRELFFALIGRYLPRLHHVVRHELARLQATGDVPADEPTADDVVDAVLLRAYREFIRNAPERKIMSWLLRLTREHLAVEVARLNAWRLRTPVRLEADAPDTPPAEWVSTLGDEILDSHEADEDLKVEDVIPDIRVPTPEQVAETRELRRCVNMALAGMPDVWRRALLHRHLDGLDDAGLARALGRSPAEIRRVLDHARECLRERLAEAGCPFHDASHV